MPVERLEALEDFEDARPWIRTAAALLIYVAADIAGPSIVVENCYKIADRFLAQLKADLEEAKKP